jgi:hypothetical protein
VGVITLLLAAVILKFVLPDTAWFALPLLPLLLYILLIFCDATIQNKNPLIGYYAVIAAFVQLMGYGFGFLKAWWLRCVLGKDEFTAFEKNFYD